jgi:predicted SprT family Zn-dependent metalloprotease
MLLEQRKAQVTAKVKLLIEKAEKMFNIKLPEVAVKFDLRGRCAGTASARRIAGEWYYTVRFNVDMLTNDAWDHLYNNTVPHELAHTVCQVYPKFGRNHDSGWKRVCVMLGGNGERCHSEEVTFAKGKTYEYTASCGTTVRLSQVRHNKIQRGATLTLKSTGGQLHSKCAHSIVGQAVSSAPAKVAAPVAAKPAQHPAAVKKAGAPSNAALIRSRIAQAKARNEGMEAVIDFGQTVLGMTRALSTTYVKNNWAKV